MHILALLFHDWWSLGDNLGSWQSTLISVFLNIFRNDWHVYQYSKEEKSSLNMKQKAGET